jgi:UbiD family decarboxylase
VREFLKTLEKQGNLTKVKKTVNPRFELASVQSQLDGKTVVYEKVAGSKMKVVSGTCSSRQNFALALNTKKELLLKTLSRAAEKPKKPRVLSSAPSQEVVQEKVDLNSIPILTHLPQDGGPYVTSAVAVIKDPRYGRNMSFHRLMQTGKNTFTARVVENRGTHTAWKKALKKNQDLEIAFCIGNPLQVMLAAAMSPKKGVDEFGIANALKKTPLVKCVTKNLEVPSTSEIILEGRVTPRLGDEGPFTDLTNTLDHVRKQPVIEIDCITHRKKPFYHALLPASQEHKLLMGMPREPTIYAQVSKQCDCKNVLVTPGGCSWLHAVIQIKKKHKQDGKNALKAAFKGHSSLKHCLVVDEDVNVYDPKDLEWAIATRVQADRDVTITKNQPSSSLDPSAKKKPGQKTRSAKAGIDATIPWKQDKKNFQKISYKKTRIQNYVPKSELK